jgi:hypothetical protein
MKKRKLPKKSTPKRASRKAVPSRHPVHDYVDEMRDAIHAKLASAGITSLSLRSLQFAPNGDCPEGQHWEKVCITQQNDTEVCTWKCVSN